MTETEKKFLKDFVNIWIQSHQEEMVELIARREELVVTQDNKFASNKDKSLRHALELPTDLARKMANNFPAVFARGNKKELHWFMKEFPVFSIPEKI